MLDPVELKDTAAGPLGEPAAAALRTLRPSSPDLKASGAVSLRQIAAGLNERGIPTARGGEWSAVQIQRVIGR